MYIGLYVNFPLFWLDFNDTLIFLDRFSKNNEISNFMEIHLVGAELLHADGRTDGQTDITKVIVRFHKF